MLRLLVAALLLANLLFFTWSRGWLDAVVGIPAQGDREPQRLASQVKPELVSLLPPMPAASAASGAAPVPGPASGPAIGPVPGPAASVAGAAPAAPAASTTATAPAATAAVPRAASAAAPASAAASAAKASATAPAASKPDAARTAPMPPPPASAASVAKPPPVTAAPPASAAASAAPAAASNSSAAAPSLPASSTASAPPACLEAGPFGETELAAAEGALRATLPAGTWEQRKTEGSGEWMIYMGPYPDRDWLERKKGELGRIRGGVQQEEVTTPAELANGLSLGRYPNQAAANASLAQYRTRGIRTARVLRSGTGPTLTFLRVPQAEPALSGRVAALKLPGSPRRFTPCPR